MSARDAFGLSLTGRIHGGRVELGMMLAFIHLDRLGEMMQHLSGLGFRPRATRGSSFLATPG